MCQRIEVQTDGPIPFIEIQEPGRHVSEVVKFSRPEGDVGDRGDGPMPK